MTVTSDKADATLAGPVAFQQRSGVDTDAGLAAGLAAYQVSDRPESFAQDLMIVIPQGITGDAHGSRAVIGRENVWESGADDCPFGGVPFQQKGGIAAYFKMIFKIAHRGVVPPGQPPAVSGENLRVALAQGRKTIIDPLRA